MAAPIRGPLALLCRDSLIHPLKFAPRAALPASTPARHCHTRPSPTAPPYLRARHFPSSLASPLPSSAPFMPAVPDRDHDKDTHSIAIATADMSIRDHSPMFTFDDPAHFDTDNMIFDFDDMHAYEPKSPFVWDPSHDFTMSSSAPFPASPDSTSSQLDTMTPYLPPSDRRFAPEAVGGQVDASSATPDFNESALYANWLADPEPQQFHHHPHSSAVPIPIPSHHALPSPPVQSPYVAYSDSSSVFPDVSVFSPQTAYAALQPLPRSFTPEDTIMTDALRGDVHIPMTPPEAAKPAWAMQLWDSPAAQPAALAQPVVPFPPLSDDAYATQRQRVNSRRGITPVTQLFQSSSAPSISHARPPPLSRGYSRRAESISEHDDATIRIQKKKRAGSEEETHGAVEKRAETRKFRCFYAAGIHGLTAAR